MEMVISEYSMLTQASYHSQWQQEEPNMTQCQSLVLDGVRKFKVMLKLQVSLSQPLVMV